MATYTEMSTTEFDQIVKSWIATAKHRKTGKRLTQMAYQPMVEVLSYLRANGFKNYVASGGGTEFMRTWVGVAYRNEAGMMRHLI